MSQPPATARPMGAGRASQILQRHAAILARSAERRDQVIAQALKIVLAQRSRLLTEKFGPPRDFSRPPPTGGNAP